MLKYIFTNFIFLSYTGGRIIYIKTTPANTDIQWYFNMNSTLSEIMSAAEILKDAILVCWSKPTEFLMLIIKQYDVSDLQAF